MPSFQQDHMPIPIGSAVMMTQAQVDEIKAMVERIVTRLEQPPAPAQSLTDAQFDELKRLLQPGFELSTLMLADYKAQMQSRALVSADPAPPIEGEQSLE